MLALLQRVTEAAVHVDGEQVAAIGHGLLVLIGIERGDADEQAARMVERLTGYRVFEDGEGKMNLSVRDVAGSLLLVPQFTLAADTRKGTRPSFTPAAPPDEGRRVFERVLALAKTSGVAVRSGRFAAHMQVALVNDGPVTFMLAVRPSA